MAALRFLVTATAEALARKAAAFIADELAQRPDLLLCASAGGSPTRSYELLARRSVRDPRRFARLRVIKIDEWFGVPPDHPASCEGDLRAKLLGPLGVSADRYVGFRSEAADPVRECERIQRWLAAHGPIDVCVLGLGTNGHIAMNEPASAVTPHAHVARLAPSSRRHPMLESLPRKPKFGMTLGMADILSSRRVLLLVSGPPKRAVLEQLRRPEVTPRFPASFLWLHPDVSVICDRAAAGD